MLTLSELEAKLLTAVTNFTPKAKKIVPPGTIMYKRLLSYEGDGEYAVAVLLVTKKGVVPRGFENDHGCYDGKFRVRGVLVLDIVGVRTGTKFTRAVSCHDNSDYVVGKYYSPSGFTEDLTDDCGQGVHGFATVRKAYTLAI